jgi:hypothetical protein
MKETYQNTKRENFVRRAGTVSTVFLMLCEDGIVTQPQCWKTLVNSSNGKPVSLNTELYLSVHVGANKIANLTDSMKLYLISQNLRDTDGKLEKTMELFKYALATFKNMEQCYLVSGYTVPIAKVETYLERTKSRVRIEGHDYSELMFYDPWFKVTRAHMEEIMDMKDDINALCDPYSQTFQMTITPEHNLPEEVVIWTLMMRRKGRVALDDEMVCLRDPIMEKILKAEFSTTTQFVPMILKDTKHARAHLTSIIEDYKGALFFLGVSKDVRIYKWLKDILGWVGSPEVNK